MRPKTLACLAFFVLPTLMLVAPATAQAAVFEGFEQQNVLDPPEGDFYSFSTTGSGTFVVTDTTANTGDKSFVMDAVTSGSSNFALDLDVCEATGDVSIAINTTTGGTIQYVFGQQAGQSIFAGTSSGFAVTTVGSNGGLRFLALNDGGSDIVDITHASSGFTNEWLTVVFRDIDCSAGFVRVLIPAEGIAYNLDVTGTFSDLDTLVVLSQTNVARLDDIDLEVPASLGSGDTQIFIDDLLSMEVSQDGQSIITRQDAGDNVTTYTGLTLSQSGTVATDCQSVGKVATLGTHTLFFDCDPGGAANEVRIRGPSLGSPTKPSSGCGSGACEDTIDLDDVSRDNTQELYLKPVPSYPFDYSTLHNSPGSITNTVFGWGFADSSTGSVGVDLFQMNAGTVDKSRSAEAVIDSSGAPDVPAVCMTRSGGSDYLGGVSQNAQTKFYRVSYASEDLGSATRPTLSLVYTGSSALSEGNGLSCAGSKAVVSTNNGKVYLVDFLAGTEALVASDQAFTRGVSISSDARFGAYIDSGSDTGFVFTTNPLDITGSFNVLANGTFVDVAMDQNGQNAWVALNNSITRYTIFPATTGIEEGVVTTGTTTTTTTGGLSGIFRDADTQALREAFGGSDAAANGFLAILVIAGMIGAATAGLFALPQGVRATLPASMWLIASISGLVLGVFLAWVLGVLSNTAIFVLVVLIIGSLAAAFMRGRSG